MGFKDKFKKFSVGVMSLIAPLGESLGAAMYSKEAQRLEEEKIVTQTEILQIISSIIRGEETEEIFVSTLGVPERVKKKPSLKDRLKAIELMAKRYNAFAPKGESQQTALDELIAKMNEVIK